jgi:putative ABC transport system permease protein
VLACLGWPCRRIGIAILTEVLGVGLAAGLLGLAISVPLARTVDVKLTVGHALLAVPVALGLTLVAGIVPAFERRRRTRQTPCARRSAGPSDGTVHRGSSGWPW